MASETQGRFDVPRSVECSHGFRLSVQRRASGLEMMQKPAFERVGNQCGATLAEDFTAHSGVRWRRS
jgi:hypothetical protein